MYTVSAFRKCDNSDTEEDMPSDDSPMKAAEVVPDVMPSNGMITEDPSCEDIASKEDLEDGELEEGEIDDDEENTESKEVTEDVADTEQEQPPQQLEKIPPLLLKLKNIARQAPDAEEEEGEKGSGAEGTPSGSSNEEQHQAHAAHKKKKKKKQKKKRKREEKEMKKKKKKYVDHDQVEDYPAELDTGNAPWTGSFRGRKTPEFFRSTSKHRPTKYDDLDDPSHSPPGPYDSPYDSPPGPYDSPSDEDEFGPPPKLQRYDDEKSRYRASKKASLLRMLEDEYMDPNVAANENKDLYDHDSGKGSLSLNKQKKLEKAKYYRELQKQREMRNSDAGKQQRPICKFYKDGKCAKGSSCPFSHDVRQQHRPEICKFYLNSVCSKGDNCLYMHGTFPCRFFHAGGGCIHGDNCRFSHEELTDETRHILERVLAEKKEDKMEGSPRKKPSLLGSPPRHLREQMMGSSPRDQQVKKIPSLFDIKVFPPNQSQRMKSPSQGGPPGPMSPPPRGMGPNFYSEMRPSPNRMPPPIRPNMMMPPPGMGPPRGMMPPDVNREGLLAHPGLPPPGYFGDDQQGQHGVGPQNAFFGMPGPDSDKSPSGTDDGATMPAGQTDQPGMPDDKYSIPVHLAPKQRELFLRIQQQQRERDASVTSQQNSKDEDDENDNWYSSDEEDGPKPSNMLMNMGMPPGGPMSQQQQQQQPTNQKPPVLNLEQMLNVIKNAATSQPPPVMGDGHLGGGMNPGRDPRTMMGQAPAVDPRTGLPHPASKANDPRLHSAASNMSSAASASHDAAITIDASLAQSGGGVPYVVRRLPNIPAVALPAALNMFEGRHTHDPRVQQHIKKLEPTLIQQQIAKGDAAVVKQRIIPLVGENENVVVAEPPVAPPPPLALPPLLQNTVMSSILASGALQNMARFPQPRFQQPPPNFLAAAAMATMSHVRLGRTMSQPPPSEVVMDPCFQRRDSHPMPGHPMPGHPMQRHPMPGHQMPGHPMPGHQMPGHPMPGHQMPGHQMPGHPMPGHQMPGHQMPGHPMPGHQMPGHPMPGHTMPAKVIDPRVARLHESRSQDSTVSSVNVTDVTVPKALASSAPVELPSLLQTPPPPLHPGLKPAMADPRTCKTQGTGSASSSGDDQGDSPQHATQHVDSQRPLLSHRNDPRFKKRHKAVNDAPSLKTESNVAEAEPVNPPPLQRRGMEYSSPLGGNPGESVSETSAGNAYNRPPNSRFQQLQQHQKRHDFKSAKTASNNGKTMNTTASLVLPQVAPVVTTTATLELTPEQLQLPPGAAGDEPSLKAMFKTFDPTASPFC